MAIYRYRRPNLIHTRQVATRPERRYNGFSMLIPPRVLTQQAKNESLKSTPLLRKTHHNKRQVRYRRAAKKKPLYNMYLLAVFTTPRAPKLRHESKTNLLANYRLCNRVHAMPRLVA